MVAVKALVLLVLVLLTRTILPMKCKVLQIPTTLLMVKMDREGFRNGRDRV